MRSGEQAIPYQPVLEALRTILELRGPAAGPRSRRSSSWPSPGDLVEPIWLSEISRLLPEMHTIYPGLPAPMPLEAELARARFFEALCRLTLAYAADRGPVLFCLDDLQWMDALTKAWLIHLGRLFEDGRHAILILGTYRSEEAEAILDLRHTLARAGVLCEVRLMGLREAAVLQLLQSLAGRRPGEELLARRLHLFLLLRASATCHIYENMLISPWRIFTMSNIDKRSRLTIDLPAEIKRRLRLLSARHDISMRKYVLETLEERLARDWAELREQEGLLGLSAQADPVLADLWDNEKDAAYDNLP